MSLTINDLTLTDEARRFDHFSIHNAVSAEMSCPELTCRAYVDILTRNRWRELGYRVRKGQRGAPVETWIRIAGTGRRGGPMIIGQRKTAVLFCRHQVERRPARGNASKESKSLSEA